MTIGIRSQVHIRHPGRAPYGYRFSPQGIVVDDREQLMVTAAKSLRGEGFSLYQIARILYNANFASRNGKLLEPSQVKCLLRAA